MQDLHLAYLAEWKNGTLAGREQVAASASIPTADALRVERREILPRSDDDSPFFTDGPYIETKEYIVGSRNF
jgi:hypothetical protein